ncbi:MAG: M1 family peptidase [Syntrophobacterales bacterium]|nr:MAG: M1 family peptidase [Syntrophobacterales bacterium]
MPDLIALNYRIRLVPDLARFTFDGRVDIRLEAPEPVTQVVLNAVELAVWRCSFERPDGSAACAFRVDPAAEQLCIDLPETVSGPIGIQIDYAGKINDRMAGFYRSRYTREGRTEHIAVTQFEESDARRAFPCLDHPAQKAVFDIELEVDRSLTAVSNTAVLAQEVLENGRKRVVFESTPKMSTYLVFFGVGPFETLQDHVDSRVRVLTLPGQQKFAGYGLEFGRKALQFSESYYGIPYPLSKMDLIAVPDFAFGAMENWGAITFRENLLLHYPDVTSRSGEERICEVIAHEIAHQWFGNLVTPSDWNYLWLNESFATYFGYGVVARYHPEWEIWQQFLNGTTASAMTRDGLLENYAIEIPGGAHLVINTSTAPIIYNKGGSILRQIEGYIGPDAFQKGLRRYLNTHAYQCADSRHLWDAFEAAAERPVNAMMKSWVEQPGFPVITATREGGRLVLTQKRFTYLPNDSGQSWLVPVSLLTLGPASEPGRMTVLMEAAEQRVDLGEDVVAFKLNDGQTGFYRVRYADPEDLERLGKLVREKRLPAEDRWGLQNDLYALAVSGDVPLSAYLDYLRHFVSEDAYLPLASIAGNLSHAYLAAAPGPRAHIAARTRPWFEAILGRIGYAPRPDERQTTAILRDQLLFDAVQYGSAAAEAFALERFGELRRGGPVHPDILKSVMQAAAWCGTAHEFEWFDRRLTACASEHERMLILSAIGCFRSSTEIERALDYVLTTVPPRNKFIPIVAMSANPHAVPLLWDWYVNHLTELEQFHPMLYERVIASIVPVAGIDHAEDVRRFFADYILKNEKAADVIRLSLERLEINQRMRSRNHP